MIAKKYCPYCAGKLTMRYSDGKRRRFCRQCQKPIYENPLPATAAVVIDENDAVLLTKRSVAPKKGKWCLPGGFVELGEPPQEACLRELHEETGIAAEIERLVDVVLSPSPIYHSVLVMGYTVKNPRGEVRPGDDCSEAAFFKVQEVPRLAFRSHQAILTRALAERKGKRTGLIKGKDFGAYVITSKNHIEIAAGACRAGARILQYRDKISSKKEILENARKIRKITAAANTLFIVNDYIDVALLCNADGVHLGQDDIPIGEARKIVPAGFIIGRSTHSLQQALEAEEQGADYIGSGPVFATPTKETYIPIGSDCVRQVVQRVKIPVVAIGGLTPDNIHGLYESGVRNFAMVRAFQDNTEAAVKKINDLVFAEKSNDSKKRQG